MEKFENGFELERKEPLSEQEVVEILKDKGPLSPEFRAWVADGEKSMDEINSSRANLMLSVFLSRIYYKAGYTEEAIENLLDNREVAYSEGEDVGRELDILLDHLEAGKDWVGLELKFLEKKEEDLS